MPTRNFRELLEALPPARRERIEQQFQESIEAVPLEELRRMRQISELQVRETMHANADDLHWLEHNTDVSLRTLSAYIEALGGHLEVRAVFPDREIRISQFSDAGS